MSVGNLYDSISQDYAHHDFFNIISSAMSAGIDELKTNDTHFDNKQILDLGSGDGKMLDIIHDLFPRAQLTAVDASADMLKLVHEKLPGVHTVQANINAVQQLLPAQRFDLVIASFVCAYVGMSELLKQAQYLLKENGQFLLITSTQEAFSAVQKRVQEVGSSSHPWHRFQHWWMKKTLEKTLVPQSFDDIQRQAAAHHFQVLRHRTLTTPLVFNTSQEALNFAEKGGWAISLADYPWTPAVLLKKIARQMINYYTFPFHDQMIVEVVLLSAPIRTRSSIFDDNTHV